MPLCTLHNESRDHIFTFCVYGVEIWRIVQQWIQAKPIQSLSWDQHLTEVLRESNAIAKEIAFVCSARAPPRISALMSTFRFSCD
ncbi:hypothetical protein H5410_058031 [Solanum commersonii]|uniref:Uncharacterized protein n=1 Tax=Solanum commersonii TaxID=4109 RepID=A0A9J5WPV2_SOLCO|nr:hypothetical protein H5410_058031 [Solanum commersonii]